MKKVKLKYVDFWPDFEYKKDLMYQILKESDKFYPEISDSPDYIVYSTFGKKHLSYNCIRIFYAGEEQSPDFNICDYGMGFDYLDFGDRYFRLPLMYQPMYRKDYERMMKREGISFADRKFCSFVYSNSEADPFRENFFDELSKYKQVDSGGRYRNNIGGPVVNKYEFESKYKFSIAFENVKHPGYSTEKLMQAFAAGGVPIYWGDPLINRVFNENAFINIMNFSNIKEGIELIKYLDTDDKAYQAMLSEPAINSEWNLEIVQEKFRLFIENIFEQDINSAKRTSRQFWNKKYVEMQKKQEKLYQSTAVMRSIRYKILKKINFK